VVTVCHHGGMPHAFHCLVSDRSARPVPVLIVSVGVPRVVPPAWRLYELMLGIGWQLAAAPVSESVPAVFDAPVVAELTIGTWGMRLRIRTEVNDGVLTADADGPPDLPAGWWSAVGRQGGHCAVIVVDVMGLDRRRKLRKYVDSAAKRGAVLTGRAVVIEGDA